MEIRCAIVNHMVGIAHLLLGPHVPSQYTSIQQYIAATRMNHSTSWGTDVEIHTVTLTANISFHLWHGSKEMVKIFIRDTWKCVQCWKGDVYKTSKSTLWCGMWCVWMFICSWISHPCIICIVSTAWVICKLYKKTSALKPRNYMLVTVEWCTNGVLM